MTSGHGSRFTRGVSRLYVGLFGIALFAAVSWGQTPNKQQTIKLARQSYYSLNAQGLAEFQCTIVPNWHTLLTEQKLDADTVNRAVLLLNKIHFTVSLAAGSDAKVTHNDVSAENAQMAQGLSQIYSGMEQMTTGFFQTWTAFSLSPALPEAGADYQLETTAAEYRISYKEGAADIVTILDRDYAINYLKTTTPEFDSTLRPQFRKSSRGWLLSGYQATYVGKSAAETTELQIAIDYQTVSDFQLPQKLDLKGTYGGSPFHVEVTFSGCTATRH